MDRWQKFIQAYATRAGAPIYTLGMTDPSPAIFFDDGMGLLAPVRDLRPVFDVRTGALTTRERLCAALNLHPAALFVRPPHAPMLGDEIPVNEIPDLDGPVLVINGRCPLPLDTIAALGIGQAAIESGSGDLVAARVTPDQARALLSGSPPDLETVSIEDRVLISRPWHVRSSRDACLDIDLQLAARTLPASPQPDGCCHIGDHPLLIDPAATILPASVFDTTGGPIAIHAGATVRPAATIIGPVSIGQGSTVLDRALIRAHTAVGPVCKVAGEIGGTIFQGYANKGHDGYLGDSWVGEWVNLGAGTTGSNLLNTYGEITSVAEPGAPRERTGETFFGCVLGDHTKTAIGTRIMTGSIVNTGTMYAATAPISGCVERFSWVTDAGIKRYRADRFIDVMRTAMGRRKIEPSGAYCSRVEALVQRAE